MSTRYYQRPALDTVLRQFQRVYVRAHVCMNISAGVGMCIVMVLKSPRNHDMNNLINLFKFNRK
jgi:hypothetical protein